MTRKRPKALNGSSVPADFGAMRCEQPSRTVYTLTRHGHGVRGRTPPIRSSAQAVPIGTAATVRGAAAAAPYKNRRISGSSLRQVLQLLRSPESPPDQSRPVTRDPRP